MRRCDYREVLAETDLLRRLTDFEATVIGTPPLGIDIKTSDIDIACTATDLDHFRTFVATEFGDCPDLEFADSADSRNAAVRAMFTVGGWEIELWCQTLPILQQRGVRHFHIERQLLEACPGLREKILEFRCRGLKTEPAFAAALGLTGDPYEALLELEGSSKDELLALLG